MFGSRRQGKLFFFCQSIVMKWIKSYESKKIICLRVTILVYYMQREIYAYVFLIPNATFDRYVF